MTVEAIIVGAGGRGDAYASFAIQYPNELRVVGVAEPRHERRQRMADAHRIAPDMIFDDWQSLLESGRKKSAVIFNCTMDRLHYPSTLQMLEAGYNVLLEKPISPVLHENVKLIRRGEELGRLLQICHVLRYSPFWQKLREVIDSGVLGQIICVSHMENLMYWHMAHSFVRGNWANEAASGPMILSKCCHDFDILYWLLRKPVVWLSSFGSLSHFRPENAPDGAPERCTDGCPAADTCKFEATRLYVNNTNVWPANIITPIPSSTARLDALRTSPYGRCVYRCDNTVVDHQIVNMELEDGTTVSLTMNGHANEECRTMRYDGTRASLFGKFAESGHIIRIHYHHSGKVEDIPVVGEDQSGHGGGDFGIVRSFINAINGNPDDSITTARDSLESHLLAFAAEESRRSRAIIYMPLYRQQVEVAATAARG